MKFLLLTLLVSCSSFADFVYMKESENRKEVVLSSEGNTEVMSASASKDWAIYPDISSDAKELIWVEGPDNQNLHLAHYKRSSKSYRRFHHAKSGMILHPKFTRNQKMVKVSTNYLPN